MPFGFHPAYLIILLVIVLVIFGPGKLPDMGGAIGRSIKEFRKASTEIQDEITNAMESRAKEEPTPTATATPAAPEAPRPEAPKVEAPHAQAPHTAETAAPEAPKPEAPKTDPAEKK